eukprot:CAMPEP_0117075298 /NCGR_PEP_ID=MMETSP0472-20121206/53089_1 /TAXON_ID=693140 ORGANISM="Tiarina fusus, Strain LIS" /NCGR_SAMPLE_ID=MMETSP0472 /ASSEMBLY_ACC=CAM_ASM_000603 /LENGTH=92 /DNA_ID=CAMNT_0004800749 /DNA_START=371 /DNA_END=649 /DNA_ORIENTATION=-
MSVDIAGSQVLGMSQDSLSELLWDLLVARKILLGDLQIMDVLHHFLDFDDNVSCRRNETKSQGSNFVAWSPIFLVPLYGGDWECLESVPALR